MSTIKLGKVIESEPDEKEEKEKPKKKKSKKEKEMPEEEEEPSEGEGKKIKKSVSFKLEPEIETYDNSQSKRVVKKVKKVVQIRRKKGDKEQSELEIVDMEVAKHDSATSDLPQKKEPDLSSRTNETKNLDAGTLVQIKETKSDKVGLQRKVFDKKCCSCI